MVLNGWNSIIWSLGENVLGGMLSVSANAVKEKIDIIKMAVMKRKVGFNKFFIWFSSFLICYHHYITKPIKSKYKHKIVIGNGGFIVAKRRAVARVRALAFLKEKTTRNWVVFLWKGSTNSNPFEF